MTKGHLLFFCLAWVCEASGAHVESFLFCRENLDRRVRQGPGMIEIPSGTLRVVPLEPRAFVPFNQYVIKLKSQLKNFQRC